MTKDEQAKQLAIDFAKFSGKYPKAALTLVTGLFVSMVEVLIENGGGNTDCDIMIEGEKRNITLHKPINEEDVD